MKNSPDQEWFNRMKDRLRYYTEDPDDDSWDKIIGNIQRYREPVWIAWSNRVAAVISLVALLWLVSNRSVNDAAVMRGVSREKEASVRENGGSVPLPLDNSHQALNPGEFFPETMVNRKETTYGKTKNSNEAASKILLHTHPEVTPKPVGAAVPVIALIHGGTESRASDVADVEADSIPPVSTGKDTALYPLVKKEAKKSTSRKKRMMLYASVTPLLAYQKIAPVKNDGIVVSNFKGSPILSGDRLGVSIEMGVEGRISDKLQFYSGFSMYTQSQTLTYQYYQPGDEVSVTQQTDFDYTLRPGSTEQKIRYAMRNIGGKAGILYYIKGDRLQHKFGAGLSYQYGIRSGMHDATYNNAGSQYLFYQLFYRNEYSIGPSMKIFVQPFYSHTIFANEKLDAPFKLISNRAGIGFGVLYSF